MSINASTFDHLWPSFPKFGWQDFSEKSNLTLFQKLRLSRPARADTLRTLSDSFQPEYISIIAFFNIRFSLLFWSLYGTIKYMHPKIDVFCVRARNSYWSSDNAWTSLNRNQRHSCLFWPSCLCLCLGPKSTSSKVILQTILLKILSEYIRIHTNELKSL